MEKYKLLKGLIHKRGTLEAGTTGTGYYDPYRGCYIIWFKKHQKEFYWFPVFIFGELGDVLDKS